MSDTRTAAATQETMRRAAIRQAGNPARLAKAVRIVGHALDLGLVSIDDLFAVTRDSGQRQAS